MSGRPRLEQFSLDQCNSLCAKCLRHCRQPQGVLLLDCPRFQPRPFKIVEHRYEQLDLFGKKDK